MRAVAAGVMAASLAAHQGFGQTVQNAQTVQAPGAMAPPAEAATGAECAAVDRWSLRPTWNIPYISASQTLFPDCNGWRGRLADAGIGIGFNNIENGSINFKSINAGIPDGQQYVGQKATGFTLSVLYLTFDLDRLAGIGDAKLVTAAKIMEPSWATIGPNYFGLNSLYYDQRLLAGHVEIQLGYIENDFEYIGTYVGGKFAGGTLGPQATIPYEVGLSNNVSTAPAVNVRTQFDDFYNQTGLQRSIPPGGNVNDVALDRLGFKFNIPGTRALVIDEVGYQRRPTAASTGIWIRVGGLYNFTRFSGFGTGKTNANQTAYALADVQLLQTHGRPGSGLFVGGSVMYAPPGVNLYSQYYEFRLYDVGPFAQRPYDLASFVVTRTGFSQSAVDDLRRLGTRVHTASTGATVSYTYRLIKGLWLGGALTYTRDPAFRVQPADPNALSGTLALTLWG